MKTRKTAKLSQVRLDASKPRTHWIATWAKASVRAPTAALVARFNAHLPAPLPSPEVTRGTFRSRFVVSRGGSAIRLVLSNRCGRSPLPIGAVSVGKASDGLRARPGSLHRLTFGGIAGIVIAQGAAVTSDPVDMTIVDGENLVVSVYAPEGRRISSELPTKSPMPAFGFAEDDATLDERPAMVLMDDISIVSEVDVAVAASNGVVVTLGDSITEGRIKPDWIRGWPGVLAERLAPKAISVVNAGIGANRVLLPFPEDGHGSALERLDNDVLSLAGITHVVVLAGVNDIGLSGNSGNCAMVAVWGDAPIVSPHALIAGYQKIITRARGLGVRVIGGTLMPFEGAEYYSEEKEGIRQQINHWIRTSGAFDGLIDFDALTRDPAHPSRLRPDMDSGDHLHPGDEGERLIGDMIDLGVFAPKTTCCA